MMAWLATLLFLLACGPLAAQEALPAATPPPAVVVRQSVEPASGAVIGQHVVLHVDVLFRGEMPRPPRVGMPDVPGLQIIRFETQGTTMRDSLDGETYVGQRFEFALYPRRGGTFDIPPASVTLFDRAGDVSGDIEGSTVRLSVVVPPGVDPSGPVVATRRLSLNQQWSDPPAGRFQAGDAIVRTITRSAEDVPGLALRDLETAAPEGVRVYADPPDIQDTSNRGVVTGHRTDRITYVFQRGGGFDLPSVEQPWWNLAAGRLETAVAEGVAIRVAGAVPAAPEGGMRTSPVLLGIGVAILAALGLGMLLAIRWLRTRQRDPERASYAALEKACVQGNAAEIYRCFSAWMRLLPADRQGEAIRAAGPLLGALFAGAAWARGDATRLLASLAPLRRRRADADRRTFLPPLNPRPADPPG
ncbi:BatD family protein [Ancylobacter sp. MQZ15Z-1]|uniref:BatD family protein n=1 Tax=Ancylobacter mangrovi TaxID=2972472 RepID=A0A9X2PMB0_9HYPH|nr:BatD family protein [Ancylobacter mangrovi]MCS0497762.1 BatD family protein [Ancylobacter mangrovi]